jgi:hypothetical protein
MVTQNFVQTVLVANRKSSRNFMEDCPQYHEIRDEEDVLGMTKLQSIVCAALFFFSFYLLYYPRKKKRVKTDVAARRASPPTTTAIPPTHPDRSPSMSTIAHPAAAKKKPTTSSPTNQAAPLNGGGGPQQSTSSQRKLQTAAAASSSSSSSLTEEDFDGLPSYLLDELRTIWQNKLKVLSQQGRYPIELDPILTPVNPADGDALLLRFLRAERNTARTSTATATWGGSSYTREKHRQNNHWCKRH